MKYYHLIDYFLPDEVYQIIIKFLYSDTSGDPKYRKLLTQQLNAEVKMNFCYNCRRYLITSTKNKVINKKFVNNWDNILRNIYNNICVVQINTNNVINNSCLTDKNIVNHWQIYQIKITDRNFTPQSKYIKIHYNGYKYLTFKLNDIEII